MNPQSNKQFDKTNELLRNSGYSLKLPMCKLYARLGEKRLDVVELEHVLITRPDKIGVKPYNDSLSMKENLKQMFSADIEIEIEKCI